ncbi:hypothetical protein ACQKCU_03735 [Heyndrickxia sporothermodurans]
MDKHVEKEILLAIQQINEKLGIQGETLQHQGKLISGLEEATKQQGKKIEQQGETLKLQGETLKEHGGLLSALITGQESLKAELSEMRLQNAKDFAEIKEQLKNHDVSIEILKEDTWTNREDIRKIQNTLGMN